jgi:hypothetical protein
LGLEAEPPGGELLSDGISRLPEISSFPATPALQCILSVFLVHSALDESALRRGGINLPHIPEFAEPIFYLAVRHSLAIDE